MELIGTLLLILPDILVGSIAYKLGKDNQANNKYMAEALMEMKKAVDEMKLMNGSMARRMDRLEIRLDFVEDKLKCGL